MKNLEQYIEQLNKQHQERIEIVKNDYEKGRIDCRAGIYDKFYRYNRTDDGQAYDLGWTNENKFIQNETVKFLYNNL